MAVLEIACTQTGTAEKPANVVDTFLLIPKEHYDLDFSNLPHGVIIQEVHM